MAVVVADDGSAASGGGGGDGSVSCAVVVGVIIAPASIVSATRIRSCTPTQFALTAFAPPATAARSFAVSASTIATSAAVLLWLPLWL